MKITLPWPDMRLTPNAKRRKHWRSYQPAAKADRETGRVMTYAALSTGLREIRNIFRGDGKIPLTITFFPPDARHRDDDGMIGAFKHLRDGIADALAVDDRRFRPDYRFEAPAKPGRVEVILPAFHRSGEKALVDLPEPAANQSGLSSSEAT